MSPAHAIIPLKDCADPALVGGKAAGLGALIRHGVRVPSGFCLTTEAYHAALRAAAFDERRHWAELLRAEGPERDRLLDDCRARLASLALPPSVPDAVRAELDRLAQEAGARDARWAVRSSATDEDAAGATFAGVYRTDLGVTRERIIEAIVDCWVSLWTATSLSYHQRMNRRGAPAMAVVVQPLLAPHAAGVAYSRHPVTGQADLVVINAVPGLAEALVNGQAIPDQLEVRTGGEPQIVARRPADARRPQPALSDGDALMLAEQVRTIERTLGHPVDVEWAIERGAIWFLQARAIPARDGLTEQVCVWSRANFKETLPELPSPLGLCFLRDFMEQAILRHYRTLGCAMPPGLSSVRIVRGRPYINVSLFQSFMAQLGGQPESITDQMGGQSHPLPVRPPRLPLRTLLRAGLWMEWQMRRAARTAPRWFAEIKRLADEQSGESLAALAPAELLARLDRLGQRLYANDLTFATVGGVSQGLYVLHLLLTRRLGPDARALLNASLQGRSQAVSAQQILRLVELADAARREAAARSFLTAEPWQPERFRERLAGTTFLHAFDGYLADYGHRAVGESDVASPRFAETPSYLLGIVRAHLQAPAATSIAEIRREQEATRDEALRRIRAACGWRVHERLVFRWWHKRLARYLALREANRHALMHFCAATRRLFLAIGERLTAGGALQAAGDIFFLTSDEVREIVRGGGRDWNAVADARRAERARNALVEMPDTLIGAGLSVTDATASGATGVLRGLPISPGYAEGPARLVRSPEDRAGVRPGDILIVPAIDPGMAPLFGLAAGLVAEIGGTLSHGAIIAREYGLPAVANVTGIMRLVRDGERIAVDADRGVIARPGSDPAA
jgi:pyruvate,water dikinase